MNACTREIWRENRTVIFFPAFIASLLCNQYSFFVKPSFLLAMPTSIPRSHSTFTLNIVQLAYYWQLWWTWFQWSPLCRVWSETPYFNNNVLPLNRKWCLGSEVFQKSCWQRDHDGSCDCSTSLKIMPYNCFIDGCSSPDLAPEI